jgi:hypothetical protein
MPTCGKSQTRVLATFLFVDAETKNQMTAWMQAGLDQAGHLLGDSADIIAETSWSGSLFVCLRLLLMNGIFVCNPDWASLESCGPKKTIEKEKSSVMLVNFLTSIIVLGEYTSIKVEAE